MISTDYVDLRLLRADSGESDTPKEVKNKPEGYWDAIFIQKSREIERDDALSFEDRARANYEAAFQQLTQYYSCQQQATAAADALATQEATILSRLATSDETVSVLTENKAAAQATLQGHTTEKNRLENEKRSKLSSNQIQIARTNSQIATSRGIIGVKEGEKSRLQTNIDTKQNEVTGLRNNLSSKQGSLSSLQAQLASIQAQVQYDENGEPIEGTNTDTSALEAQIAQLETEITSLNQQIEAKENEIQQLQTEKTRVESEIASEQSRLAEHERTLAALNQERQNIYTTYDPKISEANNAVAEAQAELEAVSQELDTNLQDNYNISLEAAEIQKKRAEATTFLTSINYMVTVQEAEVAKLEEELREAEEKSEEAKKSFEEAEANTQNLEEGTALAGDSLRLVA